jgi:hypothetical protein
MIYGIVTLLLTLNEDAIDTDLTTRGRDVHDVSILLKYRYSHLPIRYLHRFNFFFRYNR